MGFLAKLARREIKTLQPCVHGCEAIETAQKGKISKEILDFSANVNPLGPSPKALAAIRTNFWRIPFYPDSNSKTLKAAIAKHVGVSADNIIVGNGSSELIWLFAWTFIKNGDEALIPAPTFGEYEIAVKGAGGRQKFVKLNRDDFDIRADDFVNRMNSRTKLIFLCNPNNPTGRIIAKEELLKIVEEAEQKNILVFVDEDFMDFVDKGKHFTFARSVSTHQNIFVLKTFTKIFALAGIRVGYGIGCKEMIELLHRAKMPWNVNCLAQVAAAAALTDDRYIEETQRLIAKERTHLSRGLAQIDGLKVFLTDANFILVDIRDTGLTAARFKEKLLKHGILIRDCSSFRGLDKCFVRIAIRTRKENAKLLEAVQAILGNN